MCRLCWAISAFLSAAVGISVTNLTSAGQVAGVEVIAASGSLIEIILCQLVINLRYSLMSLSLSQKLDPSFTLMHRLFAGYGVTDEIFAVASAQTEPLKPSYMYGLILTPFLGWSTGTLLGALAGDIMPVSVTAALSLMLYGMFIAIIVVYIAVMAVTTYLIRVIPFAAVRGKIKYRFINSVLYYIPFAVLSAMTFPAIFYATGDVVSSAVGTVIALVMAYFNLPLIAVALASSVGAFITSLIIGSI